MQLAAKSGTAGLYTIWRPNKGLQENQKSFADIERVFKMTIVEEAKPEWKDDFVCFKTKCYNARWYIISSFIDVYKL
jgi:hypothetical protein